MSIVPSSLRRTLALARRCRLLSAPECAEAANLVSTRSPLAAAAARADSLHIHLRVDDTAAVPRTKLLAAGARIENEVPGYAKFAFAGGVNLIISSIPVAQDDLLPGPRRQRPFVDHLGLDLRRESAPVRKAFDAAPAIADRLGWRHVAQGGNGKGVACCHTVVAAKHWLYPAMGAAWTRPIELAFGPLEIHGATMGCDLRPIDPAHPDAAKVAAACCAAPSASGAAHAPAVSSGSSYYDPADLARFGDMGAFAKDAMSKFFAYYAAATDTDGALTKREKALIALAVAHAKQCPYCIDAYSQKCLATGADAEQMHEAVHVAAALSAGIDLVHGVQMHKVLRAKGRMEQAGCARS